jgi:hypothetical protein
VRRHRHAPGALQMLRLPHLRAGQGLAVAGLGASIKRSYSNIARITCDAGKRRQTLLARGLDMRREGWPGA